MEFSSNHGTSPAVAARLDPLAAPTGVRPGHAAPASGSQLAPAATPPIAAPAAAAAPALRPTVTVPETADAVGRAGEPPSLRIETRDVSVYYGGRAGLKHVTLPIVDRQVTALIGPSGCGKTTFLRALNRLHDLTPGSRVEGKILLDGEDIYDPRVDVVEIRRRIGMVFQRPVVFPTMSIFENVAVGLRLMGMPRRETLEAVERALRQAALWDEVKDRLAAPGTGLSGGQQQRLSIARALAVSPEVLLMDEPTSAIDPQGTQRIEELIGELKQHVTLVIVTHNLQQAARIADYVGFFLLGELVEYGDTSRVFVSPRDPRTEAYVTGRFG